MQIIKQDILMFLAIILNLAVLIYSHYHTTSVKTLSTIAVQLSNNSKEDLFASISALGSLLITGIIMAIAVSIYLYIRPNIPRLVLNYYSYMFFLVLLMFDIVILNLCVPL